MTDAATPLDFERLLATAARDPAERPAFARAILDSDVFVLGSTDRPTVGGIAQAGTLLRLVTISDDEGPVTPFFTSEAMIQAMLAARPGTDPQSLRLRCRALFEATRPSRLVLNPYGPHGKTFLPGEVDALLAGTEPGLATEVLQAQQAVLVGAAAHIPAALPEVLARFLVKRPVVQAAHLGWIVHPDGHAGYLMVVIADDRQAAMEGFGHMQIGDFTEGKTLDVMVLSPHDTTHLLSAVPPFYNRPAQRDPLAAHPSTVPPS